MPEPSFPLDWWKVAMVDVEVELGADYITCEHFAGRWTVTIWREGDSLSDASDTCVYNAYDKAFEELGRMQAEDKQEREYLARERQRQP